MTGGAATKDAVAVSDDHIVEYCELAISQSVVAEEAAASVASGSVPLLVESI